MRRNLEVDAIDEADERDTAGEVGGVMSDPSGTATAGVLRVAFATAAPSASVPSRSLLGVRSPGRC